MSIARLDGIGAAGSLGIGPGHPSTPHGTTGPAAKGTSFADLVAGQLRQIDGQQHQADAAIAQLATGQSDNVQDVVMTMAKADLTFRFALEIRNRLLESYQEIMRMQV